MLVRCYRHSHHSYVTIQDTTVAQTYGWARRGGWRCRCNGARAVPLLTLSWSPGLLASYILCPVPTPPAPRGVHLLGSWCAGNCTRTCPGERVSTGRILAEGTGTSGRDCAAATWIRTDSTGWLTALQPLPAMDRSEPPACTVVTAPERPGRECKSCGSRGSWSAVMVHRRCCTGEDAGQWAAVLGALDRTGLR